MPAIRRWIIPLLLLVFASVMTACQPHTYTATLLEPAMDVTPFTLEADTGEPFTIGEPSDQWQLVYFGYTFCPDICPATLFQVKLAMEELGNDAEDIQVIMVTVDPDRDTADQLDKYLGTFNESFLGLRADTLAEMEPLLTQFGVYAEAEEVEEGASGYLVSHTGALFIIDPDGNWRGIFQNGVDAEAIAADMRALMR